MMPQEGKGYHILRRTSRTAMEKSIILEQLKSEFGQVRKAKSQNRNYRNCQSQKHFYPLEAKVEEAIEEYHKDNKINTLNLKVSLKMSKAKIGIEWKP